MMLLEISGTTSIKQGFLFRGAICSCDDGEIALVQMKNITEKGVIRIEHLDRINTFPRHENFLLRGGDVLVLSRGARNTAAVVTWEVPKAIASSNFLVLQLKTQDVLPEYLALYLNHPVTQAKIREISHGTSVPLVTVSGLGQLPISVPPRETQETLIELHREVLRAEEIEETIRAKRRTLLEKEVARFFV